MQNGNPVRVKLAQTYGRENVPPNYYMYDQMADLLNAAMIYADDKNRKQQFIKCLTEYKRIDEEQHPQRKLIEELLNKEKESSKQEERE